MRSPAAERVLRVVLFAGGVTAGFLPFRGGGVESASHEVEKATVSAPDPAAAEPVPDPAAMVEWDGSPYRRFSARSVWRRPDLLAVEALEHLRDKNLTEAERAGWASRAGSALSILAKRDPYRCRALLQEYHFTNEFSDLGVGDILVTLSHTPGLSITEFVTPQLMLETSPERQQRIFTSMLEEDPEGFVAIRDKLPPDVTAAAMGWYLEWQSESFCSPTGPAARWLAVQPEPLTDIERTAALRIAAATNLERAAAQVLASPSPETRLAQLQDIFAHTKAVASSGAVQTILNGLDPAGAEAILPALMAATGDLPLDDGARMLQEIPENLRENAANAWVMAGGLERALQAASQSDPLLHSAGMAILPTLASWAGDADSETAISALQELPEGEVRETGLATLAGTLAARDPLRASEILRDLAPSPTRDAAIVSMLTELVGDADSSLVWVKSIADPALQAEALAKVVSKADKEGTPVTTERLTELGLPALP